MTTNITETLPWIDYKEVFTQMEERVRSESRKEGITEGITEGMKKGRDEGRSEGRNALGMEIALKVFKRRKQDESISSLTQMMKDLGISDEVIEAAGRQLGIAPE